MKKLVTAFAACIIAGMVSAAVESINIVGYANVPIGGNTQQTGISPAFLQVGGANQTILTMFDTAELNEGDILMQWDESMGDYRFFTFLGAWYDPDFTEITAENVDTLGPLMTPGSGFMMGTASSSVTLVGQVNTNATESITFTPGYTYFSSPYPVQFDLNSVAWTGASEGDTMSVWSDDIADFKFYTFLGAWYDPDFEEIPSASPYYMTVLGGSIAYYSGAVEPWSVTVNSPLP